jgi:phosphatidylglycerol---prolipoprotein diacylglyceryl transferase
MHPELFKIPGTNFMVPGYGAMVIIAFLGGTWWMTRRAMKVKADPDIVLSLALLALLFGWLGGRVFYVIHYWKTQFAHQPWAVLQLSAGGFEVYGGLILAAAACVLYLWIKRVSIRLYADLTAPTLLFGMGVGRLGCYLVGCCWGATCPASLPWAVTFPAMSSAAEQHWQDRIIALPAELIIIDPAGIGVPMPKQILKLKDADVDRLRERLEQAGTAIKEAEAAGNTMKAGRARAVQLGIETILDHLQRFEVTPAQLAQLAASKPPPDAPPHQAGVLQRVLEFGDTEGQFRSAPVHPAQLYSAIGPLLLALLMNAYFFRRKRHGMVMLLAVVLYAVERFIEELVRMDNPHDTFGLTISQGVSIGFLVFAGLWYLVLRRMPLRSPWPATRVPKAATPLDVTAPPA